MSEDSLGLGVPRLDFDIKVECRFKDSGANKTTGLKNLSLVAIPKFGKKIEKSTMDLTNEQDFEKMFGKYK